ncbi:protein kinase domain-containing protein [Candidatus Uabimicrobium amorphum]|uniref:Phosphatidylinositol-4-phosphate 5-kinase n=1 Tax=Uabimicrobium amorphum TaxID=2596890 RepID=A0A5S9INL9_UABAM|nr:serine/threonine-protein kinase [Candidatus Uabimicrobium amorphum]BBM85034.1 phosphatidylinositol-4-phosphate 5-kinase [Candidatus Uabimicrobium amorphum]
MNIVCYNNKCKAKNPEHATWCLKCNNLLVLAKRYKVEKFIAQGAMGKVYLAEDQETKGKVVVKVLQSGSAQRFSEEARLGKRAFEHKAKHLVHVLEELEIAGRKFIIQNYIQGGTLQQLLENENDVVLPFSRKLAIAANYASALEEMRSMEIVHRDLKPENTMVGDDDHITILDFGLAKDDFSLTLTTQGEVMGTYYYIAPESLQSSHNADFSADIFSVGVILYEIFHGRIPHDFSLVDEFYDTPNFVYKLQDLKRTARIYPAFPGAPQEVKKLLTELINKCLNPDPGKRCASIYMSKILNKCIKCYDDYIGQQIKNLPDDREQLLFGLHHIPYVGKLYAKSTKQIQTRIKGIVKHRQFQRQENQLNKAVAKLQQENEALSKAEAKLKSQLAEKQKENEELTLKLRELDADEQQKKAEHSCDLFEKEHLKTWLQDTSFWEGNAVCKALYEGQLKEGKPIARGKCEFFYGGKLQFLYKRKNLVYEGEWYDGVPHGQGSFVWINGDKYEGEVKNGKKNGRGRMTWACGSEYVGEWKDNQRHGWGTYVWGNGDAKKIGDKYTGQFTNDTISGHGTLLFANGEKYSGEFHDGERTGHGTFVWNSGEKYTGEFRNANIVGQGMYLWPNGDEYVGSFYNGERTGYGTFTHKGERYIGEFKDGQKVGKGTFIWPNGNIYEGEFRDNGMNGHGTLTWAGGNKYIGDFKDGRKNGEGTLTTAEGDKYEGQFRDDQKNGQGTYMWANGDIYVGKFKDDQRNGPGTFMWANGDKFEGKFKDDQKSGHGTFMWANGEKYVGKFKDDKKHGHGIIYESDQSVKVKGVWDKDVYKRDSFL